MEGQKLAVEVLLAAGAPISERDMELNTPLHYAVERDHKEIVELLIEHGAEITNFHLAVYVGSIDKVKVFLGQGIDINAKGYRGKTAIDIAMSNGHIDIASLLIDKGAKASFLTKMRVNMARQERRPVDLSLLTAAQNGEQQKVKVLLDQGADINAKDDQGMTPLHLAAQEGHKEVVEFLLSKDADITAQNIKGYTPLYSAIWSNDPNMVGLSIAQPGAYHPRPFFKRKTPAP
jgi:ankyrin repeat protein